MVESVSHPWLVLLTTPLVCFAYNIIYCIALIRIRSRNGFRTQAAHKVDDNQIENGREFYLPMDHNCAGCKLLAGIVFASSYSIVNNIIIQDSA